MPTYAATTPPDAGLLAQIARAGNTESVAHLMSPVDSVVGRDVHVRSSFIHFRGEVVDGSQTESVWEFFSRLSSEHDRFLSPELGKLGTFFKQVRSGAGVITVGAREMFDGLNVYQDTSVPLRFGACAAVAHLNRQPYEVVFGDSVLRAVPFLGFLRLCPDKPFSGNSRGLAY